MAIFSAFFYLYIDHWRHSYHKLIILNVRLVSLVHLGIFCMQVMLGY